MTEAWRQQRYVQFWALSRTITIGEYTITLKQQECGVGGSVWDAAIVVTKYLANHTKFPRDAWKNIRAMELGAGCGLCGIALALMGCKQVVLTDTEKYIPLLKHNVHRNLSTSTTSSSSSPPPSSETTVTTTITSTTVATASSSTTTIANNTDEDDAKLPATCYNDRVTVATHWWGTDVKSLGGERSFDVIVATDCIYEDGALEALVASFDSLLAPDGVIYLGLETRLMINEQIFWDKLWPNFTSQLIDISQLDPEYRSPDIRVYHIRRRRATDAASTLHGHIEPPLGAPITLCTPMTDDVRRALATPPIVTRTSSMMLKRQLSAERKKPAVDATLANNTALF